MQVQENFSLKRYNTFSIDVLARSFVAFNTAEQLQEIAGTFSFNPATDLVLGGGSNLLLTRNVDGMVYKNEITGIHLVNEDENYKYIQAGAGENWHEFVLFCIDNNLGGVENLSLIPGNVGASPMQNIGAYGVELQDVFSSLDAFHLQEKKLVRFGLPDCRFRYRNSVFKNIYRNQFMILNVTFRLSKKPVLNTTYSSLEQELAAAGVQDPDIRAVSNAVIRIRRSKLPDPARIGNAGSFFKNPEVPSWLFVELKDRFPGIIGFPSAEGKVKLAAGWLIEQCGWKGYRRGDAGCHAKQALVLVNFGNASGKEIYELSEEILASVKEKFGVELEREVNII
jgi:UDP-N-acetylmuramate dehydrogenase